PIGATHDKPLWGNSQEAYARNPVYGQWLSKLFDLWWQLDDPSIFIRLYCETVAAMLGGRHHTDMIVNDCLPLFCVNTDGRVEYPDYFRSGYDGSVTTAFNIQQHSISELELDPLFSILLRLGKHLPAECNGCSVREVCGGGFLPGRIRQGRLDPTNRAVHCFDQYEIFTH
ncbi:hypothetical protein ACQUZK_09465, partial [Streptococcus pyogenes]|uniref:hypothetical protein n=1 Tax=Streptococcus pyogenes TaxID=1314 RepID=UPI003D9FC6EC